MYGEFSSNGRCVLSFYFATGVGSAFGVVMFSSVVYCVSDAFCVTGDTARVAITYGRS